MVVDQTTSVGGKDTGPSRPWGVDSLLGGEWDDRVPPALSLGLRASVHALVVGETPWAIWPTVAEARGAVATHHRTPMKETTVSHCAIAFAPALAEGLLSLVSRIRSGGAPVRMVLLSRAL